MITISAKDDISPNTITEKINEWREIIMTPHIWNFHRYGYAITSLGTKAVLFDGNYPLKDTIAFPSYVIVNNQFFEIAPGQELVTSPYLLSNEDTLQNNVWEVINVDKKIWSFHFNSLKKQIPNITTTSNYFFIEDSRVHEILEVLMQNWIICFNRFVDSKWKLICDENNTQVQINWHSAISRFLNEFINIKERHVDMILNWTNENNVSWLVTSNDTNIFVMIMKSLLDSLDKWLIKVWDKEWEVYIFSGISMINYIKNPRILNNIKEMYRVIRSNWKYDLPEELTVNMLPWAVFKNMPTENESDLHDVMDTIAQIELRGAQIWEQIKLSAWNNKNELINLRVSLKKEYQSLHKDFTKLTDWQPRITQYDNEKIVIPDSVKKLTLKKINQLFNS